MMMIDRNPSADGRHVPSPTFDIHGIDPLIRPLIPYFAELTTERIAGLRAAAAEGSFDQIKRLAHTIKGSAASYGFPALADIAARIEHAILKPERAQLVGDLIEQLAGLHGELLHIIETAPELFEELDEDA